MSWLQRRRDGEPGGQEEVPVEVTSAPAEGVPPMGATFAVRVATPHFARCAR